MSANISGFYAAYISGKAGQGFALVAFKDGAIAGADVMGALYDGRYLEEEGGGFAISMTVKLPPNVMRVQGGVSGPQGEDLSLSFMLKQNFSELDFVRVETPHGPVNTKFVKLRGFDV